MEDYLYVFVNGIRPQLFCKWKTTSLTFKMKGDLYFFLNRKCNQLSNTEEDDLKLLSLF